VCRAKQHAGRNKGEIMDVLTFTTEVIKSIAWPALILIVIIIFRNPILKLIPLLTRLKYKDFEIEFSSQVKELKSMAEIILPDADKRTAYAKAAENMEIYKLAEASPRLAILKSWQILESEVNKIAIEEIKDEKGHVSGQIPPKIALRLFQNSGKREKSVVSLIRDMYSLKDQAAIAPENTLSPESAIDYSALAFRLSELLKVGQKGD
jgi:hypothetical protein